MTVIVNTVWGGRVSQVVDRQISRKVGDESHSVVDRESNKVLIVLTNDALVSIAYTGIAVADCTWMDCVIANCLAHRKLDNAMIQPGISYLARPIHTIIDELALNLNGKLNGDKVARTHDLKLSIVGFHLSDKQTPLAWELSRGSKKENGFRYFKVMKRKLGKFLREHPNGLWGETLGNSGNTIDEGLAALGQVEGMTHDDVELYIRELVRKRASETKTVSSECIAIQIDLRKHDGQVQATFYPDSKAKLLTPWVLTPRMVSAPSIMSSSCLPVSECGKYALGGFEDVNTNLNIQSRLPIEYSEKFKGVISMQFKDRIKTP